MQQSSTTQSLHLSFWGLLKSAACSHPPSCIYSFWYGVIPTSYFIFILVIVDVQVKSHSTFQPCYNSNQFLLILLEYLYTYIRSAIWGVYDH